MSENIQVHTSYTHNLHNGETHYKISTDSILSILHLQKYCNH